MNTKYLKRSRTCKYIIEFAFIISITILFFASIGFDTLHIINKGIKARRFKMYYRMGFTIIKS